MNLNVYAFFDLVIFSLVSVAFLTLLERKILGLSQSRKGPNKVSVFGVFQPISDALKLAFKEPPKLFKSNKYFFFVSPVILFASTTFLWAIWETKESVSSVLLSSVYFLVLVSFGIYPMFLMGWSSNSKYSFIGAIRSIAQTISYEISMALIILSLGVTVLSLSFKGLIYNNSFFGLTLSTLPLLAVLWLVTCMAETNRTPFDFSEGESELVSGFNTEYGSATFTLIFLGEYLMILFFSFLISFVFFSVKHSFDSAIFGMLFLSSVWVWVRSTLPRYRYDKLMNLAWKSILPLSLFYLVWAICSAF